LKRKPKEKKQNHGVVIFTEEYLVNGVLNAACYSDLSKEVAIAAEACMCDNPYKCHCGDYNPPHKQPLYTMDMSLFNHPRPHLMYTIQREGMEGTRFTFFCKMEYEVQEEIDRLNAEIKGSKLRWIAIEEERYNTAARTDYRDFQLQEAMQSTARF
jgi:hypothetical protein